MTKGLKLPPLNFMSQLDLSVIRQAKQVAFQPDWDSGKSTKGTIISTLFRE